MCSECTECNACAETLAVSGTRFCELPFSNIDTKIITTKRCEDNGKNRLLLHAFWQSDLQNPTPLQQDYHCSDCAIAQLGFHISRRILTVRLAGFVPSQGIVWVIWHELCT